MCQNSGRKNDNGHNFYAKIYFTGENDKGEE